jgi:hypothetical protein
MTRKEGKVPVLALADKGRPGFLVCIHSDDLETVAVENIAAHASDDIEGEIRRAYTHPRRVSSQVGNLRPHRGPRFPTSDLAAESGQPPP